MNTPEEKDRRWESLVRRAQGDVPPALDVDAMMRQLDRAPKSVPAQPTWGFELNHFLGSRLWLSGSLAACGLMLGGWFVNEIIEKDLPWVELAAANSNYEADEGGESL